jgi:hypothetical protein
MGVGANGLKVGLAVAEGIFTPLQKMPFII